MTTDVPAARAAANYRTGTGFKRCWNCEHFSAAGPGAEAEPLLLCKVLQAPVEATAVCDSWAQMADRAKKRTGFRSALRQHGTFLWEDDGGASGSSGKGGGGGPVGL